MFELEAVDAEPPQAVDVVPETAPRVPEAIPDGTSVVFHPFVPAPEPSPVA